VSSRQHRGGSSREEEREKAVCREMEGRRGRDNGLNPKLACLLINCLPYIYKGVTIANGLGP
jgi:hypothetical protein